MPLARVGLEGEDIAFGKILLPSGGNELLLVPVGGGQPRKLDSRIRSMAAQIRTHPDGRQIAWTAGESKQEIWVLESFLPAK